MPVHQLGRSTPGSIIFAIVLICIVTKSHCYQWPEPNSYMTRWDKVNLDEILENKKLLRNYYNCLMNKGPCPPDGRELKRNLPEALETACSKCSQSQIDGGIKVIKYLRENEPRKFETLANKYDPHRTYRHRYLQTECNEIQCL